MRDEQFSRLMVALAIIIVLLVVLILTSPLGMYFLGGLRLGAGF